MPQHRSPSARARTPDGRFPESGQTIAGFRLVEELGRGSFARVFRAEERRLADRPVVLKVSRLGSREPQTLARLQHTHIVPVHSYRTDRATGLHLLCMPYFGRLTLARVLAEPAVAVARTGADLVAALDRLEARDDRPRSAGRNALARRTYPRAIAWWGRGWPRPCNMPTSAACCTATSSRPTSSSPTTACRCSWTSTWPTTRRN